MKQYTSPTKKKISFMLLFFMLASVGYTATYTATASGKFSNTATWAGGVVPSTTVATDQIVVKSGITVDLDNNLTLDGATSQLNISGTLNTSNNSSLIINIGTLSGAGTIVLNIVTIKANATYSFDGALTANSLNTAVDIYTTADIVVNDSLNLSSGTLSLATGGSLSMGSDGTIIISGGLLSTDSGGNLSLSGNYNVLYTTTSATTGVELSGSGLKNITMDINASNTLTLSSDLKVPGTLSLLSGILKLSGKDFTINGKVATTGSGKVSSTVFSNIIINTTGVNNGALRFTNSSAVNKLIINVGSGYQAAIEGSITVLGILQLNSGVLNFNNASLTISGGNNGSGSYSGNSNSNLTLNTPGIKSTILNFAAGGNSINDLCIDLDMGDSASLVTDLIVNGTLKLKSGILNLNNYNITIKGNIADMCNGTISSTAYSDIVIATTTTPTGPLNFTSTANTVGNLILDIGNSGTVSINSNIYINGILDFKNGKLNIGGNALIMGASGSIKGTGNSSYIISTTKGYVQRYVASGGSIVNFPVGTATHFAPANIKINAGSQSRQMQVNVVSGVMEEGDAGNDISLTHRIVNATWNINSDITSNLNFNLQAMWPAALEVNGFNRNTAYISHYNNGDWDTAATSKANTEAGGLFSLQKNGITSLSPFAVFDPKKVTAISEISNNISFEIFPNPAADNIFIQYNAVDGESINIDIYNSVGQLIANYKLTGANSTISVKDLISGNYYLKLYNNQRNSNKWFIKI